MLEANIYSCWAVSRLQYCKFSKAKISNQFSKDKKMLRIFAVSQKCYHCYLVLCSFLFMDPWMKFLSLSNFFNEFGPPKNFDTEKKKGRKLADENKRRRYWIVPIATIIILKKQRKEKWKTLFSLLFIKIENRTLLLFSLG